MVKRNYSTKRSTGSKVKRALKRPIKKTIRVLTRRSDGIRSVYRKLIQDKRRRMFNRYARKPMEDKLVLFESFMGRRYADSPKAIYEYMLSSSEYSEYKFIWSFKDRCMDDYLFLEKNDRTNLVLWGSPEYYQYYAIAGYWITNSRLIEAFDKRPEQVYVQCWHGTPLKRLGFDVEVDANDARNSGETVRNVYERDAARYTYMISPSRYCTEKFVSAFNLKKLHQENIIIEEGYPRNDEIVNHSKEDVETIKKKLRIPNGKKIILYAPTWRDNQHEDGVGYVYKPPIDFRHFRSLFGEDYIILFRAHYFIANQLNFEDYKGFVLDVSLYPEINDLYIISDMLITDYSSVFFDYGILKRPIIFYMYDLEYYAEDLRGFYLTTDDLPGPIVKTEGELQKCISEVSEWFNSEEYKDKCEKFKKTFTYLDDGHATERVVKKIFK